MIKMCVFLNYLELWNSYDSARFQMPPGYQYAHAQDLFWPEAISDVYTLEPREFLLDIAHRDWQRTSQYRDMNL